MPPRVDIGRRRRAHLPVDPMRKWFAGAFRVASTSCPVLRSCRLLLAIAATLKITAVVKSAKAIPDMIAQDNLSKINMSLVLAPANFSAAYSVKAP